MNLEELQTQLARALVEGGETPTGLDPDRVAAAKRTLEHKKVRDEAKQKRRTTGDSPRRRLMRVLSRS